MDTLIPIHLTAEFIWKHPEIIFVFDDNILRRGNVGSAKICRGYPNCYGIATKRSDCRDERVCYMNDDLEDVYCRIIEQDIKAVPRDDGRRIYVIPGIGEGYAKLPEKAPKVWEYLQRRLKEEFNYEPRS